MKIEKRLRDFYTSRGPKTKLYVWYCTNELYIQLYVCLPPYIYIYIDISVIKCNVVNGGEGLIKTFFCNFVQSDISLAYIPQREERLREKKNSNVPDQNS